MIRVSFSVLCLGTDSFWWRLVSSLCDNRARVVNDVRGRPFERKKKKNARDDENNNKNNAVKKKDQKECCNNADPEEEEEQTTTTTPWNEGEDPTPSSRK